MNISIFDDKHLANLRSLFFSNVLIFLTGILVLVAAVPKRSYAVFIVLFFCLTSGAFAQISVEESYPQRYLSFSQWSIYYKLLQNKQYCIPLNGYPVILAKNCSFLLYDNPQLYKSIKMPLNKIVLKDFTPKSKTWNIQAVILLNNPNQFAKLNNKLLYAYNKSGHTIAIAKQLDPSNYAYVYYLFDKPVSGISSLQWKNTSGNIISVYPDISVLGTPIKGIQRVEY